MKATQAFLQRGSAVRDLERRVTTEDGLGWRTEPAGSERFSFEVFLDDRELSRLIGRAARNKGGRARAGALEVVVTSRVKQ